MNLKPIAPRLSIGSRLTKDSNVHQRATIAQQRITTANPRGRGIHKVRPHSQQASRDETVESGCRNALVLEHLPLVGAVAARIRGSLPVHVAMDDLIQAGTLGLMDAANKFDTTKQVAFSAYAKHRIKGAILDSLRELDEVSRDMRRLHRQVESASSSLTHVLQRAPHDGEIAEKLGMSVESLRTKMLHIRSATRIFTSSRTDEDLPLPELPTGPETRPDAICARKELQNTVRVAMKELPQRDQKILLFYYSGDMTMKEIGDILGVNESRVSQVHKRAIQKMELQLRASGITSSQAF